MWLMGRRQKSEFKHLLCKVVTFLLITTPLAFANFDDPIDLFRGDYSPPSPPLPPQPPHNPSLSCEEDLRGTGSLDTRCDLNSSLDFDTDVVILGNGSLSILDGVVLSCPKLGCMIYINVSGDFVLGSDSRIVAGSVTVGAGNGSFAKGSLVNVSGLAGDPPAQTSGTPSGVKGGGGGYGGRGASCLKDETKSPDDEWGGDAYSWSTLDSPWVYGSRGGSTSKEVNYGGEGGGRIWIQVNGTVEVDGSFLANGGNGGTKGGGGSGGSIHVKSHRMTGDGRLSAIGGNGYAGGGGGRMSVYAISRHGDMKFFIHGGRSSGCPENSGAAGTYYDAVPRTLTVCNRNLSTNSDTVLLEFPKQQQWTNIYIQNQAKSSVPLLWGRVQVRGKIQLSGATLSFGLAHFSYSEFELIAEELLMSESIVKVYGALRMSVKMHLMWNSKLFIDGGADVATSVLEASNLVVLKESSLIRSNANLGVHGQGFLNLSGPGNLIEAQRLILSLFYSILIEPGSGLRGPLSNSSSYDVVPRLYCKQQGCPMELLHPPEDCNVNSSLVFTLQICRVEDINVQGSIMGSVVHIHWVRTVSVHASGMITSSGLGCTGGVGRGRVFKNGLGSGGGHGGKGGDGYYNGNYIEGGVLYGDANLPCELGSGSGNDTLAGATAGGGIIVMGSLGYSLSSLSIDGSLRADGESYGENTSERKFAVDSDVGPGGGSGGTILLFVHELKLGESSVISVLGGQGSHSGSGGGGGGRVHFHWSDIPTGDGYLPLASIKGEIQTGGGLGGGKGLLGENGTVTGKSCPKGLYGIFCEECPVGTYKNTSGSDRALCYECPSHELPHRARYIAVRGGVAETPCPYKCISERYHMPHCYTALEELIYTFGGPWLFSLILFALLILLALVLSVARMKFVTGDEATVIVPTSQRPSRLDHSFPFLESLNEVLETNRTEESHNHVHRMYFMGPNTFSEPWHLTHCPPEQIMKIVYEDAFNRFVDEINSVAAYQWWEGSVYSILSVLSYPLAWSWLQQRRMIKLQRIREYVRSEYDHACLRSCRSRALYEGLKVASSSDYMLAHVDFFLGGDEKRDDLPPCLQQRFPMPLVFGGDGSYMAPFSLNSDNILTSLMSQAIPPTIWYRLVAGLNAQLRLVRRGCLKKSFSRVIDWLETHANPTLKTYGICVDLVWFQPTSSGYSQYGLLVSAADSCVQSAVDGEDATLLHERQTCSRLRGNSPDYVRVNEHLRVGRRAVAFVLNGKNLRTIKERAIVYCPSLFIINNTKPIGHQDLVGLFISVLLLGDFSLVLLSFLQLYSISMLDFSLVLFILPLGLLCPFPVGINALFSHGPRRSAELARKYALWNITSLVNVVVAFICGFLHYISHSSKMHVNVQSWNISMDERGWWMLPFGLLLCKIIQAQLIDYHVANQEIQDHSLYSYDPDVFWQS